MNLDLMSVLVPTFKLGINDAVLLAEGDYRNTACLGLLVIKFQYPFKIFTACHNRIFMFCSAKVAWFMQNAAEAIECLLPIQNIEELFHRVVRMHLGSFSFMEHSFRNLRDIRNSLIDR